MRFTAAIAVLALFVSCAHADTYMHNPRGSNNRLNERSANRNNGNRLFDSQNNNRGGYNKGDVTTAAANTAEGQYDMTYYMSQDDWETSGKGKSILSVEWTNQHGCGGNEADDPHKLNCQIVLQYMCLPDDGAIDKIREDCTRECFMPTAANPTCIDPSTDAAYPACPRIQYTRETCTANGMLWLAAQVDDKHNCPHRCSDSGENVDPATKNDCTGAWTEIDTEPGQAVGEMRMPRDGLNTNRQDFTNPSNAETEADRATRKANNIDSNEGLHEPWEWYDECYRRERNRGLFTADQNLRNNNLGYSSAVYTRQNPNNNRRGYECPEERDHYPYWHPSPWKDIVVMTDRLDLCPVYQSESQNVKAKHLCRNTEACPRCLRFNNERQCVQNEGRWQEVGAWNITAPMCVQAPWSRVNHNGNGRSGQHNTFNWTLPAIMGKRVLDDGVFELQPVAHKCVLRLRYNISTDDYDTFKVNSSFNNNNGAGIKSPVKQNPNVDIGARTTALRLAINTAQFGRTFQDRSHVFRLVPRPSSLAATRTRSATVMAEPNNGVDMFNDRTLYNLNVRGKRGNIVQTYPSVEYDFVPNLLHVTDADLVHIQWTGSNTHNNGNPAGDGQAGDAGEGTRGTDRHNFVELRRFLKDESFPAPQHLHSMFPSLLDAFSEKYAEKDNGLDWENIKTNMALRMATSGYYTSYNDAADGSSMMARTTQINNLLNNAPASFPGAVLRFHTGVYNYMCTRNHNFSNRDQKGTLIVAETAAEETA